jgi:cobalt-zinc-cadmium efflux system membrane fusion protein
MARRNGNRIRGAALIYDRTKLIALCALFLCGCGREAVKPEEPEVRVQSGTIVFTNAEKAPRLNTAEVTLQASARVRLNGRLAWNEDRTVRVYSPFAGRVTRILVQPGDRVRRGQTLAILGSPEFGQAQAEARRAETDVSLAEKNLQRVKELESFGVSPRKDLQVAEAEYARARSELERARGRVRLYGSAADSVDQTFAIASPIDGTVVERTINPGQEIRPDQITANVPPLFVVTNPTALWAMLDATEKDLPALTVGKRVSIRAPVYEDERFEGRIANVSDFLDPATRTLKVRATIDNSHRRLKAEMFVTGEIELEQPPHIEVPAKAVFFQGGKNYVFVEDGPGRYTRREVRVGDEHDGKVEVLEGLAQGLRVVSDDVLMLQQMVQPRRVQK